MTDGRLRQIFQQHLPEWHFQTVETFGSGRGIPDLNGCYQGIELWLEMKLTKHWKVNMRSEQVGWIERRLRAGGRVFIAVRRLNDTADELYLLPGSQARALCVGERPSITNALGMWRGGPARWAWPEIEAILISWPQNKK